MSFFALKINKQITHSSMNRPESLNPMNPMSPAWWAQLDQHLQTLQSQANARDHSTADALKQTEWLQSGIRSTVAIAEAFAAKHDGGEPHFADLKPVSHFFGVVD